MQIVKLTGVIFALSIKVLIGVMLAQLLKINSGKKTARPSSYGFVATRSYIAL